jgi:hypothetical protein
VAGRVRDVDRGYRRLLERVRGLARSRLELRVGVQGDEAAAGKEGAGAGLTVGDVAAFHEFGLGHNPERSFVRGWFDEALSEHRDRLRAAARDVVDGRADEEQALGLLGVRFVGEVQERISRGVPPPNAPSTIAAKGSSTPLVDTGQLRASVSWRVAPR